MNNERSVLSPRSRAGLRSGVNYPRGSGLGGFLPRSGGPSTCGVTGESAPQAERLERRMGHPSASCQNSPWPDSQATHAGRAHLAREGVSVPPQLAGASCPGFFS